MRLKLKKERIGYNQEILVVNKRRWQASGKVPGLTPNINKLVVEPPRVAAEVEAGVEQSGPAQDTTEAEAEQLFRAMCIHPESGAGYNLLNRANPSVPHQLLRRTPAETFGLLHGDPYPLIRVPHPRSG
ncbi:uncharacterized protein A4U43_UnF12200 [Asparagus officinalis]|uniref:Uncharacterized protein n=1 Tax=Asparagus officinalis TaxID=4686 RepID=A0A1R3L551_ASPOF|nr:uncharacterized protein A4U43_UnF12200 [Asparagus officinalis]